MKKLSIVLAVLLLAVLCLAACTGNYVLPEI